ncbi:hypothetical protein QBC34DRAFT_410526 [Podospora aff. communis PSN243]|uniref:F-box domain-containing protein n=1 Tax=Podospora aff. communis PSN243 TaxID=3040156 RepID=A0AAV9GGV5_9PEZI|nr:hypothetical protein QBC34DRAFT_410526 [Podospora aff. communis PSN243]
MALARLPSLPTELLSLIFQQCSTIQDLLMLGATCRRLHDIFRAEGTHIAWSLGIRTLPVFDLALIAVRATKVVCDSLSADRLPSPHQLYPIQKLSGTSRLPTIDELRQVNDLQHFGRCVEHLTLLNAPRRQPAVWFEPGVTVLQATVGWPRDDPRFPEAQRLWRERLYRNIFRLMICGACLAGPFHQPFFYEGPDKPKSLLRIFTDACPPHAMNRERDFLLRFPVYNGTYFNCLPVDPDELEVLSPLAHWLAEDMRLAAQREGDTFNLFGEKLALWPIHMQVLHCIWTVQQLNTLIAPVASGRTRGDEPVFVPTKVNRRIDPTERPDEMAIGFGKTRTITVILHGVYHPETITMPARPGDQFMHAVSGAYTRHNLLSSTLVDQPGSSQIMLSRLHHHLAHHSSPGYGWVAPSHMRIFACLLQKIGGMHPLESNRLFTDASARWTRVVSILAIRHSFESELETIVKRRLPENYTVQNLSMFGSLPLSF